MLPPRKCAGLRKKNLVKLCHSVAVMTESLLPRVLLVKDVPRLKLVKKLNMGVVLMVYLLLWAAKIRVAQILSARRHYSAAAKMVLHLQEATTSKVVQYLAKKLRNYNFLYLILSILLYLK